MKTASWLAILNTIRKISWALFLVCLPVTSFPFFPSALGGGALVRPLSLYPLLVLVALVVIPYLLQKPIPATVIALLPFVLVVLISSALALLRGIEGLQGVSLLARLARALITLGLGGAMYLAVALFPRTAQDLKFSLRWLYAGFMVALLFGSLQAIYVVHYSPKYFQWLGRIQQYLSIRRLFTTRISGMTYEPNWFGEQICFLLMPWLMAAVLTGFSAFRWRWRWLTVEWLLLGWASLVLIFTFSRAGLAIFIILAFVGLVFFRTRRPHAHPERSKPRLNWLRRMTEAGGVVLVLFTVIYLVGANSSFFSRIWGYWTQQKKDTSLSEYFDYLGFGARFIYSETAYRIYLANPLVGVGLGNYAFYFESMMPDQPVAQLPEVLRLLTPEAGHDRLITAKNLYLRILSETGLAGLAAFTGFLVAVAGCAFYLWLSKDAEQKYWGVAGLLGVTAFLFSAISYDSFAIPNMWVVFGLITAAAWTFRRDALHIVK